MAEKKVCAPAQRNAHNKTWPWLLRLARYLRKDFTICA
ncbi:MAG: hypothetical protein OJF51_001067 [Nitrospira sp.]|nr:MAG: hypothetical protein OJF51_001067 [Nitrospira sp.]